MASSIFIKSPTPLRVFNAARPADRARLEDMQDWNARMVDNLTRAYDSYAQERISRSELDNVMANIIAGYDANCLLDALVTDGRTGRPYNIWDPDIEEGYGSTPGTVQREIETGAKLDVIVRIANYIVEFESDDAVPVMWLEMWRELIAAFAKKPRAHNLFTNANRMAHLLVYSTLLGKMADLVVWLSFLSDDTWREISTLALSGRLPSHLSRWILQDICFHFAVPAITQNDAKVLEDHSIVENGFMRAVFREDDAELLDEILRPLEGLPPSIEGILELIEGTDSREIVELNPTLFDIENEIPGAVYKEYNSILMQAGRRLCRSSMFRVILGLVSARPQLPVYELLPVIEKAFPACIYSDQDRNVTGIMQRAEVIGLIESVVRFHRGIGAGAVRETRQRTGGIDDDNDLL